MIEFIGELVTATPIEELTKEQLIELCHDYESKWLLEQKTNMELAYEMEQQNTERASSDAEIAEARRTAEYWKVEHLAGSVQLVSRDAEIAELREQVMLMRGYLDIRKVVKSRDAVENEQLRKQVTMLRNALEYTNINGFCSADACDKMEKALADTVDLDRFVLCHNTPAAFTWVDRKGWPAFGMEPHDTIESTPLFAAKEQ